MSSSLSADGATNMSVLSGFLNVGKLEEVFAGLSARLDAQAQQIQRLEGERANQVTVPQLKSFEARMENALEAIEARFNMVETRINELNEPAALAVANARKIKAQQAAIELKVDIEEFTEMKQSLARAIDTCSSELSTNKASNNRVDAIENIQRENNEQMVALQRMIACKVDRVEVPLLSAAAERVQSLLDFKHEIAPLFKQQAQDVATLKQQLAIKEDKETIVQRMQAIHELLLNKADVSWVNQHLAEPMKDVRDKMTQYAVNEEVLEKMLEEQQAMIHKLNIITSRLGTNAQDAKTLGAYVGKLDSTIKKKADALVVDEKRREDLHNTQNMIKESARAIAGLGKIQQAHLAELKSQLLEVKDQQLSMDKKIQVSLRFVDWFTDMKGVTGQSANSNVINDMHPLSSPPSPDGMRMMNHQ